ncbi:Phage antirepressor protein KilAC domain protein [uncultured archaeon]|nr:Phage antirepressor protein KilAC domain protein [uncultured archaeon]
MNNISNELIGITEKTMTVQELADSLHVSDKTIRRTIISINETLDSTAQGYIHTENGIAIRLTEAQCTRIKMELEGHHNLADNTAVKTVSNDMEFFAKSIELQKYATARIAELEKQNKEQKQQLIEQQPKVDFAETITADQHSTFDMSHVAQELKLPYGKNTLFARLRDLGILKSDNTPYQRYVDTGYFKVYPVPTPVGTKLTTKVTQRGVDYIRKLIEGNK